MKKYLFVFLAVILVAHAATAQEEKTPTKLQTMDWLVKKFKENLIDASNGKSKFISYQSGLFKFQVNNRTYGYSIHTINLNKVTDQSDCAKVYGINIYGWEYRKSDGSLWKTRFNNDEPDEFALYNFFEFNVEVDLCARIETALGVLIKYNLKKNDGEVF